MHLDVNLISLSLVLGLAREPVPDPSEFVERPAVILNDPLDLVQA